MSKPFFIVTSVLLVAATVSQAANLFIELPTLPALSLILTATATLVYWLAGRQSTATAGTFSRPGSRPEQPAAHNAGDEDREIGTVKWFNTTKGFGFISRDNGDDIFVHFRAIRGEGHRILIEGQRVEYNVVAREKGLQAEDVVEVPT